MCIRDRSPQYHAERYIGLKGELLERFRGRFLLDDGPVDLGDGLWLIPDGVDHEQSLVADTEQGLAVFNSCSHAGAGHIAKDILARFPGKKIAAYVGGLHLMGATGTDSLGTAPGIVTNLARWLLDELGVEALYTGHCTCLLYTSRRVQHRQGSPVLGRGQGVEALQFGQNTGAGSEPLQSQQGRVADQVGELMCDGHGQILPI